MGANTPCMPETYLLPFLPSVAVVVVAFFAAPVGSCMMTGQSVRSARGREPWGGAAACTFQLRVCICEATRKLHLPKVDITSR